ncbi:helix-turn-helix transcriptional regulator [Testudinibacter sp. P80/BLE/0925]|uniref:helix-turn-helix transcriptional regulator n=1 Tax=Testudinibacter sp. TW-1 TaxID=3417757 RepID=UPI003D35C9A8
MNVITSKAFQQKLGIKQTAFYNWQNPKHPQYKPDFPKPFSLGGRLNGYRENEVNDFIESLMNADKSRKTHA